MPPSKYSSLSDAKLANLSLAKNDDAFAALVKKYEDAIYRHSVRLAGNEEDGEEIAQETFIRLFINLNKLDFSKPLKPWLFQVCTNLCRNHAKKKKNISFTSLEYDEKSDIGIEDTLESKEPLPNDIVESNENIEAVRKAFDSLPKKYSLVLSLYYWENLSYEEIAYTLSMPVNTIRTHIRRAKTILASHLKDTLIS